VRRLAREWLPVVLLAAVVFSGTHSLVQSFRVDGESMTPTLESGQLLLIDQATYLRLDGTLLAPLEPAMAERSPTYLFGGPRRGEIVLFRVPRRPDVIFVKRLIGMPGDTIVIRNGRVVVNDVALDEPYVRSYSPETYPADGDPVQVPEGHYFVLGDNRPESADSRQGWLVPAANLIGRPWLSYWPLSSWGAAL
jgi:signal peptidase I